jgi:hypothetical protein
VEQQLSTVRKGSQDTVHSEADVSRLFGDAIIKEIEQRLPDKPPDPAK